jgi:hypothetical protein
MEPRTKPSSDRPLANGDGAVRARHPQTLLKLSRAAGPQHYASITSALAAETRAALEAALPMAWLPIAIDVEVIEAIAARLGYARTAQLVEARQREEMVSPLFDGFVKMALRMFGASPRTMVRRIPIGWPQLFRDVGAVEVVSAEERGATVRFRGLPECCIASAAWMAALPVGLATLYELVEVKGTVTCAIEDAARGNALVTFAWR